MLLLLYGRKVQNIVLQRAAEDGFSVSHSVLKVFTFLLHNQVLWIKFMVNQGTFAIKNDIQCNI